MGAENTCPQGTTGSNLLKYLNLVFWIVIKMKVQTIANQLYVKISINIA